ncbi:TetR/AcrR family transcriptional regulator [Aeromicrobium sp. CF3.5]|uniref:TetR/AcrR family transcriptional regulator n=1 Tax=Aeromicrobium sp. CF3.5 TaxID=3373078 RepID=UPI003EE7C9F9
MTESLPPDLADRLLEIAYDITAAKGPAAVSLREVQRRAGVSAATAYWHYKDRAHLLLAVSRRATADLANALTDAIKHSESSRTSDLSAVCLGYLHFARDHVGLFQAVVLNSSVEELLQPSQSARGTTGLAAFEVLQHAVSDFRPNGEFELTNSDASIHVWAACHGLAALLIDTPMAVLPEPDKERLRRQHVGFVLDSIAGR